MNPRVILASVVGVLAGVAISACIVDREGAFCSRDDNCPRSQYCDLTSPQHVCKELTPQLSSGEACSLALETLSQRLSECFGGDSTLWLAEVANGSKVCNTLLTGADAGRLAYAPMDLKTCRAGILGASCSDVTTRVPGLQLLDCGMFAGTVANGSSCGTDKECDAGYCATSSGCPGTCTAFVAAGDPCTQTARCAPGFACATGKCLPLLTAGGCDAGLCNPSTHRCDAAGQCIAKLGAGAPNCVQDTILGFALPGPGPNCQPQLNCVGSTFGAKVCETGGAVDTPCTPNSNSCGLFSSCMSRDGGNFCTYWPTSGSNCVNPPNAQDVFLCRTSWCQIGLPSVCTNYTATGAACGNDQQCGPLSRCIAGLCQTYFCQ